MLQSSAAKPAREERLMDLTERVEELEKQVSYLADAADTANARVRSTEEIALRADGLVVAGSRQLRRLIARRFMQLWGQAAGLRPPLSTVFVLNVAGDAAGTSSPLVRSRRAGRSCPVSETEIDKRRRGLVQSSAAKPAIEKTVMGPTERVEEFEK